MTKAKKEEDRLDAEFAARLASMEDGEDSVSAELPRNRAQRQ